MDTVGPPNHAKRRQTAPQHLVARGRAGLDRAEQQLQRAADLRLGRECRRRLGGRRQLGLEPAHLGAGVVAEPAGLEVVRVLTRSRVALVARFCAAASFFSRSPGFAVAVRSATRFSNPRTNASSRSGVDSSRSAATISSPAFFARMQSSFAQIVSPRDACAVQPYET
jgi:hypothetical protein